MILSFGYLILRQLRQLMILVLRGDRANEVEMPGDLPEAGTSLQEFVDQGVMGSVAFGHRPGRLGSFRLGRLAGRRVNGLGEAALMPRDAFLDGCGQVLPEVESIGDLHRIGRRGPGRLLWRRRILELSECFADVAAGGRDSAFLGCWSVAAILS